MKPSHTDTSEARWLLAQMLAYGGFTTYSTASAALHLPLAEAKKTVGELLAHGLIRKVSLLRPRDSTVYFQATRRGAELNKMHAPSCTRSGATDSQILRGLARFWLSTSYFSPDRLAAGEGLLTDSLARAAFDFGGLTLPATWPTGDAYVETPGALHAHFIIAPAQALDAAVKQAFLRYVDDLGRVKLGFVIDQKRAAGLQKILEEMTGDEPESAPAAADSASETDAKLTELQARFESADPMQKVQLHQQILRLQAEKQAASAPAPVQKPAEKSGLAGVILPTITHDFF